MIRTRSVDVEIADDGHESATVPGDGSGLGLVGVRERLQLLDGELVTGPRKGGGFRVHAYQPTNRPTKST